MTVNFAQGYYQVTIQNCCYAVPKIAVLGVWPITASTTSTASAKQIALYGHTTVKKLRYWSKTIFVDVMSVQNTWVYVCLDFFEHRRLC